MGEMHDEGRKAENRETPGYEPDGFDVSSIDDCSLEQVSGGETGGSTTMTCAKCGDEFTAIDAYPICPTCRCEQKMERDMVRRAAISF